MLRKVNQEVKVYASHGAIVIKGDGDSLVISPDLAVKLAVHLGKLGETVKHMAPAPVSVTPLPTFSALPAMPRARGGLIQ